MASNLASASNAWVESYLDALLSFGLSSEYTGAPKAAENKLAKDVDADKQLYSRYYVRSLLNLDEKDLKSAWSKAASAKQAGDMDARLQYLSWRIWFMKRRHAMVQQARRAAEAQEEESVGTTEMTSEYSDEEEETLRTPRTPRTPRMAVPLAAAAVTELTSELDASGLTREAFGAAEVTGIFPAPRPAAAPVAAAGQAGLVPCPSLGQFHQYPSMALSSLLALALMALLVLLPIQAAQGPQEPGFNQTRQSHGHGQRPLLNDVSPALDLADTKWMRPVKEIFFVARGARYPSQPSKDIQRPPSLACPRGEVCFKSFGNSSAVVSAALLAASKEGKCLMLPTGKHRVDYNITLDVPVIMGANAQFIVSKGATLTLTKQVHKWDQSRAFGGPGRVNLAGEDISVAPDWFKDATEPSDSDSLLRAVEACTGTCTILLNRGYSLARAWELHDRVSVFSTGAALLYAVGGNGGGVVLRPGAYSQPLRFPAFDNFRRFAIKVQGGVSLAELQLTGFSRCRSGILFATGEGSSGTIENVHVTHFTASSGTLNTVLVRSTSPSHKLENVLVRGNFIISPFAPGKPAHRPAAAVAFQGEAPRLVGTTLEFQAVHPNVVDKPFHVVHNRGHGLVTDLVVRVEAWLGGFAEGSRVAVGKFRNLTLDAFTSGGVPALPLMKLRGRDNRIVLGGAGSPCCPILLPLTPSLPDFNGGKHFEGSQLFAVKVDIAHPWPTGEERTFYLYSGLATLTTRNFACTPTYVANAGLVCTRLVNQGQQEAGRVAVRLKNSLATALPEWQTTHVFQVQVGP